ncbi:MAG: electron transfer flavoprotein subunit beta/FixA family protein [Chloroflexi bacterium]|nr:electron transfer flavoprotein subunit beta/FixA family protein [Chloroflexota bacterium]
MQIVVCVKQVPDTAAEKRLGGDLRLDRESVENVLNPFDEYAVEEALRLRDKHGGEVIALSMGPTRAAEAIRKAVAMGVNRGVLVSDPALAGSDALATSLVLAQAMRKIPFDLVVCGMQSTDALTGQVPAALAEHLGLPYHGYANWLEVNADRVTSHRTTEQGYDVVVSAVPALVSVTKAINEPRYPSLRGIMQSKRAEVQVWSLADLGVDPAAIGAAGARTRVRSFSPLPARSAGQVVRDEGNAAAMIVEYLVGRKII